MHTLGVCQINQEGRGHTFKFVVQLNSPVEKSALGRLLFVVLCIGASSCQGERINRDGELTQKSSQFGVKNDIALCMPCNSHCLAFSTQTTHTNMHARAHTHIHTHTHTHTHTRYTHGH